ncbi:hypothetical protein GCM10027299_29020 [Larkinella ripae]
MPTVSKIRRPWEPEPKPKNESRGGNKETQFYRRAPWRRLRAYILKKEPYCRECLKEKTFTVATIVDHIVPINMGGAALDPDNCQPICERHHAQKSQAERRG